MEATNLAGRYDLPALDWAVVRTRLAGPIPQAPGTGGPNRHTFWLATINPDGTPHVTGLGALYVDGSFWFETGERTRKGRNLARDPRCTLSLSTEEFDLTVEGEARPVTDPTTVAAMAQRWAPEGGRPGSTSRGGRSPPNTARRRPARGRGWCTNWSRGRPRRWRPSNPSAPPAGGSTSAGPAAHGVAERRIVPAVAGTAAVPAHRARCRCTASFGDQQPLSQRFRPLTGC